MSKVTSVSLSDNSKIFENAMDEDIITALEAIGLQAVGDCQLELENAPRRIDTGLLRNSIAYAISGGEAKVGGTQGQDYQSNATDKTGKPIEVKSGRYRGRVPKEREGAAAYVGTNVEYAPYVEYGTQHMDPNHFIQNGITKNVETYKKMLKKVLKG